MVMQPGVHRYMRFACGGRFLTGVACIAASVDVLT